MDGMLCVDCVSSESEQEFVGVLVAGELRIDSVTGSVTVMAICGLLTAVWCAKMWSKVVVVGAGGLGMGVHTCFILKRAYDMLQILVLLLKVLEC